MSSENHNLNVFRILYIIKGILLLIISMFPVIYIFIGAFIFNDPGINDGAIGGTFLIIGGSFFFLLLLVFGILTLLTAKYIGAQKHYDFIFVMAILNCLTGILGIVLGIFTIIELNKPQVRKLFGKPV